MPVMSRQWFMFILFLLLCLAGGWAGSIFTISQIPTWYAGLPKPSWTPPSFVFGPVWTTLYVMIGIAGWLVWKNRMRDLLVLWAFQLAFNFAWTPIFFGAHETGWALLDISVLWLTIVLFVVASWNRCRSAALLFLPYLAWVSYASALNHAIWAGK
jgi:translocator protein